jgi:hypothetical protein
VEQLFSITLDEHASAGPTIMLLDEVETLFTDRAAMSMDANPIDVHRAVDAALTHHAVQLSGRNRIERWIHPDRYRDQIFAADQSPAGDGGEGGQVITPVS